MIVFSDSLHAPARDDITELSGKLGLTEIGQGLMHSVVEGDSTDGKLIKEAINQGIGSFTPDFIYEQFVQNYSYAEQLYGKTFISLISGYDADYVGRNVKIPEFQRELRKRVLEKIDELKDEGLVDDQFKLTDKGMQLAALVLYTEELDELASKNLLGETVSTKRSHYGSKGDTHVFRKGDRYRDIALKRSVKRAVRRGHTTLSLGDLETFERRQHGAVYIIYGLDASGSMNGRKLDVAKKAGVALSFAALERKDNVGVIVFSKEVKSAVAPTDDFGLLLRTITPVVASHETDIVKVLDKAIELFPAEDATKHLILLSDALPTVGKDPGRETLDAVAIARQRGITTSIVGIRLDTKGEELARRIAEVGDGRFYIVHKLEEVDVIVLEDYLGV